MTVYARSDLVSVSISSSHGGCGKTHSRPVTDGAPEAIWALTCHNGCEDHLRSDPLWASSITKIPESPDEEENRKSREARDGRDLELATGTALSQLAGIPGAMEQLANAVLAMAKGQQRAEVPSGMMLLCRDGHLNSPESKFCATCGVSLAEGVPSASEAIKKDEVPTVPPTRRAVKR
jgi:hypothetical protein